MLIQVNLNPKPCRPLVIVNLGSLQKPSSRNAGCAVVTTVPEVLASDLVDWVGCRAQGLGFRVSE